MRPRSLLRFLKALVAEQLAVKGLTEDYRQFSIRLQPESQILNGQVSVACPIILKA
jgi:hypothetical protein